MTIVLFIVFGIAALGGAAIWDDRGSSAAALADFGHEQVTLANGVAAALMVSGAPVEGTSLAELTSLQRAFAPVEEDETVAFLKREGDPDFVTTRGTHFQLPDIEATAPVCLVGLHSGRRCWVRIPNEQAAQLQLPARTAMAGLSGFVSPDGSRWTVGVVASARRERDRERRAEQRLAAGFMLSSALVLGFGMLALRTQRKELALARELAVKEAVRARDERLVRADKLATMGAFGTGIAHEVATPLGVIMGRAEQLVPRVAGDERASRAVAAIVEQAERISGIIKAFLALARGGAPLLLRVDLRQLAAASMDLVQHRFDAANVALHLSEEADLPKVACDARLMEQAIANLLLNACDACEAGGGVLIHLTRAKERVAIVVTDDGVGITAEEAARATEPFFTTKPEGTGLGLAITNEIVLHHQGALTIERRAGHRGTEARIELPVAEEHHG